MVALFVRPAWCVMLALTGFPGVAVVRWRFVVCHARCGMHVWGWRRSKRVKAPGRGVDSANGGRGLGGGGEGNRMCVLVLVFSFWCRVLIVRFCIFALLWRMREAHELFFQRARLSRRRRGSRERQMVGSVLRGRV